MKTEPRRSMSVALQTADLPPEAITLIKAGTPRSLRRAIEGPAESAVGQGGKPEPQLPPGPERNIRAAQQPSPESTGMANGAPVMPLSDRMPNSSAKPPSMPLPAFASVTVRIPSEIPKRLLRAATDRKINQQSPFTQQEIVAQALAQWLETHEY